MTQAKHPALANAPKSLRESIKRMIAFLKTKPPRGACQYSFKRGSKSCTCIIGNFFTEDQRNWLYAKGINSMSVQAVACYVGAKNIKAMTGMNLGQATQVQNMFDRPSAYSTQLIIGKLSALLNGTSDSMYSNEYVPFILEK